MKEAKNTKDIIYLSNFQLFSQSDTELICNYKFFIEKTIIQLGEDWRIQSGLLAQDLLSSKEELYSQFNIFNEFLSVYLKGKITNEFESEKYLQPAMQQTFMNDITLSFSEINKKATQSLTFKTLSLGFWVTSSQIWKNTFKNTSQKQKLILSKLKPLARLTLSYKAQDSREQLQRVKNKSWNPITSFENLLTSKQRKTIQSSLFKIQDKLKKISILSFFVMHNHQLKLKSGQQQDKKVRILTISNYFYLCAFVAWLIFNIKTYFSLNYESYQKFFKYQLQDQWHDKLDKPLRKFFSIIQRQWAKLLKDYSVTLNDDTKVLTIFIDRIRKELENLWNEKIQHIHSYLNH